MQRLLLRRRVRLRIVMIIFSFTTVPTLTQSQVSMIKSLKMGQCGQGSSSMIKSRGKVEIVYSSTSGTSKGAALKLQDFLEENHYLAPVVNIGDLSKEDLSHYKGTILFLLSTYGDGDSPADGADFYQWVTTSEPDPKEFEGLSYTILAFGNSSFENHCGFGLKTEKFLQKGAAQQIFELHKCDASKQDRNWQARFPDWSKQLLTRLNESHPLMDVAKSSLGSNYTGQLTEEQVPDWQQKAKNMDNLGSEFKKYLEMHECDVLEVKELRTKEDGRSTLSIKIKAGENVDLWPACNVQVFPQNEAPKQIEDKMTIKYQLNKKKVPFPPMPLGELKKLLNFQQNASNKQVKTAALLSISEAALGEQYVDRLKKEKDFKVTVRKLVDDLVPNVDFLPQIGLNNLRTYTLSGWDKDNKTIDLCVALLSDGLTSNYFKRAPPKLRLTTSPSTFNLPDKKQPIVMIANGSGIAPFRSITQYYAALPAEQRSPLRLYYGIQSKEVDFYYSDQWNKWEEQGVVEVKVAESRRDPKHKEYVQNVLEKDVDWLKDHLFEREGLIFICGGEKMSKDVNQVIFKALSAHTKVPYKAFSLSAELKRKRVIVEEVYG